MFQKFKGLLERIYPSVPITISFSKSKIFFLFLIIGIGYLYFYFRSQNKNELELLKQKHQEIQLVIKNYINSMTRIEYNKEEGKQIIQRIEDYRKKLNDIEEKINGIKKFWFLE